MYKLTLNKADLLTDRSDSEINIGAPGKVALPFNSLIRGKKCQSQDHIQ